MYYYLLIKDYIIKIYQLKRLEGLVIFLKQINLFYSWCLSVKLNASGDLQFLLKAVS
jgi:hypothetical protein